MMDQVEKGSLTALHHWNGAQALVVRRPEGYLITGLYVPLEGRRQGRATALLRQLMAAAEA